MSTRIFRWCDTVGWDRPTGSVRSQTQASWPSWAAISDTSRSLVGSAIAFNDVANVSAAAAVIAFSTKGEQHVVKDLVLVDAGVAVVCMGRSLRVPLTSVYVSPKLDASTTIYGRTGWEPVGREEAQ